MITVLAGGVGAARYLAGLLQVVPAADVTAVVNVGDDTWMHGLRICPDLDTVTYTLAGAVNPETGWGLVGETWQAMASLRALVPSATAADALAAAAAGLDVRTIQPRVIHDEGGVRVVMPGDPEFDHGDQGDRALGEWPTIDQRSASA